MHKEHKDEEEVESPSKEVREAGRFRKKIRKKARRYNRLDKHSGRENGHRR
jgi:hypothetical protein